MNRLNKILNLLIFIFAISFIAMFCMHAVQAKGIVRSVEDHSADYPLPRFITHEQYVNDPFLLCTGLGISIPGYNSATVVSGSYSTHTTDQGKDTGELTAEDLGSATVFDDGTYKGLSGTTSKTYGYYTEATHRSATPAEVYILAELNDNTPGNGAEFKVTDKEYKGTVQEEAYVEVDGVKYYMVEYNESHEATKYVAKVNDKYYEVEVQDGEGMGNYSAVQVAWWAVSPAQEGGRVPDNSLAKEAREFEKYINALSKGGKWHYSDGEAKEATAMTLNKTELIMYARDTAQLLLSMEPTNLEKKEITWTTSDKEIAEVTGRGVIKAKKRGKVRITVALKEKPELKAECIVIIKQPMKATGIKLDKTEMSIKVGDVAELKAILEPEGATSSVTWSSSNTKVARVNNGKVTGVKKGTATITAKSNGKKATCKVTVTEKSTNTSNTSNDNDSNNSNNNTSGKTGFVTENNKIYYYENGEKVKGTKKIDEDTCYFNKKTGVLEERINGITYMNQSRGVLKNGKYTHTDLPRTKTATNNTFKNAACGIFSCSMAITAIRGKLTLPTEFNNIKYGFNGNGSNYNVGVLTAKKFNLKGKVRKFTKKELINELLKGNFVTVWVSNSIYGGGGNTTGGDEGHGGGHFVLIHGYKDGKFAIADPNNISQSYTVSKNHKLNTWESFNSHLGNGAAKSYNIIYREK